MLKRSKITMLKRSKKTGVTGAAKGDVSPKKEMQAEALSASRWDRDRIQIIIRIASGSTFVLELPCDQTVLNLHK
jgi:hypothetical protein